MKLLAPSRGLFGTISPDSGVVAGRVAMIKRRTTMRSGSNGLGTMRTAPETARVEAATATLERAIAVARAGDHQRGRELCASVLFAVQPMLVRHKSLLRMAVCALLMSQGFRLLTRITVALSGQRIRIVLSLKNGGPIVQPRCQDGAQETIYTIDPRWLAQLSVDDPFLQRWCDTVASRQPGNGSRVAPNRAKLSPEPV